MASGTDRGDGSVGPICQSSRRTGEACGRLPDDLVRRMAQQLAGAFAPPRHDALLIDDSPGRPTVVEHVARLALSRSDRDPSVFPSPSRFYRGPEGFGGLSPADTSLQADPVSLCCNASSDDARPGSSVTSGMSDMSAV